MAGGNKRSYLITQTINVCNSTTLVNNLMKITIVLKFIFIIYAFREYNSHLQDMILQAKTLQHYNILHVDNIFCLFNNRSRS